MAAVAVVALAAAAWLCLAPCDRSESAGERNGRPDGEAAAVERCEHPFVPLSGGTTWRYEVRSDLEPTVASVTGRVLAADRVRWRSERGAGGPAIEWTVRVRCSEDGAEEPWFGILEGMLGSFSRLPGESRDFELDLPRWFLPMVLEPGTTFGGAARVERPVGEGTFALSIERSYRTEAHEPITLFDGRETRAWRVSFREHQVSGERTGHWTGEMWLVADIGLARMTVAPGGHRIAWALVEHAVGD